MLGRQADLEHVLRFALINLIQIVVEKREKNLLGLKFGSFALKCNA